MRFVVFILCLLISATDFATAKSNSNKTINVIVLPTIHGNHLDPKWGYTLDDLFASIESQKPDLICVEIAREHEPMLEGLFPPEAAAIKEIFSKKNIKVIAADWRENHSKYKEPSNKSTGQMKSLSDKLNLKLDENNGKRVVFLTGDEGKTLISDIHQIIIKNDGEAADGFWNTRNKTIVDRCMSAAKTFTSKKVVVAFGIDHQYLLEDLFKKLPQVVLLNGYPGEVKDRFGIPTQVLEKWKSNLRSLEQAADSKLTDPDVKNWIKTSGRIAELKKFISWAEAHFSK